jgi:RNA polymerase sigma-70 factor (ECF subfamily)
METTHGNWGRVTPDAFTALYEKTFAEVYRYLYRGVLGNRSLAEDLTQETFAAVVTAVREGRSEIQSLPWMLGIARHKLIDYYRRAETEQRILASIWSRSDSGSDDAFDDPELGRPAHVVELLRELSPRHRLVLILRYLEDLPVREVARSLGVSVPAAESQLIRARRELARTHKEVAS